jgi:hypothetical protein
MLEQATTDMAMPIENTRLRRLGMDHSFGHTGMEDDATI